MATKCTTPNVIRLGYPTQNLTVEGIPSRCRVGDVTGILPFTHVAQHQGRVVVVNILGKDRRADYPGIPRVVFSDPEIAATGMTEEETREEGVDVAATTLELPKVLARSTTYEKEISGAFGLVVDRTERVMIGARAAAPLAGEWSHQACLAVRARTPVDTLLDSVFKFPTFSQAYLEALEQLDL